MALTARKVETAGAGRYSDGEGLALLVKPSGARSWVLRVQVDGKRRDVGVGPYPALSLAAARQKAREYRIELKAGRDPRRSTDKIRRLTFKEAAERLIELKKPGWRNPKHAAQWPSTLKDYVYPKLGDREAHAIATQHVVEVLTPIWTEKSETASRVRQRIEAVLDYAATIEGRDTANPARWRGHLEHILPRPSKVKAVKHHAALDWREMPVFWDELYKRDGPAVDALKYTILTAARSSEVRGVTWREIDLNTKVWTVPANRIKAAKEHRVPLSHAAITVLESSREPDRLVFPSPTRGTAQLSDMSLTAVLRRMGRSDITVHGFRSTFRDWAGETTGHPREVIEQALAHQLKDKAEAAYARGDLFVKRRRLMEDWAAFVTSKCAANEKDATVLELARATSS